MSVIVPLLWGGTPASAYDGKVVALALGAKFASGVLLRGARAYDGVQAAPLVYLGLFDERIQIFGTSLEFQSFLMEDKLRARTKIALFSDDPFLKLDGPVDIRSSRPSSLEWMSRLEWFLPSFKTPRFQLDLAYAHEFKEHKGNYLEATGKLTVARLFPEDGKPLVEPQIFGTIGYGDANHNSFWYAAGVGSGFTHVEYGLSIVAPARIDRHFPVFRVFRYELLGQRPIGPGSLVQQRSGFQVEATFAFGLL